MATFQSGAVEIEKRHRVIGKLMFSSKGEHIRDRRHLIVRLMLSFICFHIEKTIIVKPTAYPPTMRLCACLQAYRVHPSYGRILRLLRFGSNYQFHPLILIKRYLPPTCNLNIPRLDTPWIWRAMIRS
jgi:hypothetical protein